MSAGGVMLWSLAVFVGVAAGMCAVAITIAVKTIVGVVHERHGGQKR